MSKTYQSFDYTVSMLLILVHVNFILLSMIKKKSYRHKFIQRAEVWRSSFPLSVFVLKFLNRKCCCYQ